MGGARIGVINLAARNHGFQFGVVNIAAHDDGESLALLNLIGDGIHEASIYATEMMITNVGVKLGGRHLYTHLTIGYQPGDALAAGPEHFTRSSRRWGSAPGWAGAFRSSGAACATSRSKPTRSSFAPTGTCPATLRRWHRCVPRSGCGCFAK